MISHIVSFFFDIRQKPVAEHIMSDLSVQLETPHAGKYTQPTGL